MIFVFKASSLVLLQQSIDSNLTRSKASSLNTVSLSLSLSLLLPSPHQPTFCTHVKCIEIYMIYLDDVKKCLAALNIKSNLHYGHIGNWESWLMILHFKKIKSELKKIPVSKSQELHEGHKIIYMPKSSYYY